MLYTVLALLLFAAPAARDEGVKLYGEGRYLRAVRAFEKALLVEPSSAELRFAYLFSLKNCGYVQHVEKALAALQRMARPKNAAHEALRQFGIADSHRRLAELHRELSMYYASDPKSELAPIERRKSLEHANAARTALRAMRSERWQPLIDYGLASTGAVLGGAVLDEAAKQLDAYARLAAATRRLWADRCERGMVFDPLCSLPLFGNEAQVYGAWAQRSIEDEIAVRMLLSRQFENADQLAPAIAQCNRVLALDPTNADALDRTQLLVLFQRLAELHERTAAPLGRKK